MLFVQCPITLPEGYAVAHADVSGSTLTINWDTPVGSVFSSVDDVPANSPALWQDMLEQVQVYVRMKGKRK